MGILCAINLSLYLNCIAGVDQGEKKVTLNVVEESCVKVFKQIEKQTKMSFFYSTSDIRLPGKVSIKVVDAALDEVMGRILEGTNLEWIYTDNVITIRKKKVLEGGGNGMGTVADSNINTITVTGKVTQADGTGIPGATVRIKRTNDGITTDPGGNFSLPNTQKNDLLLISSIGYETREIPVRGNKILVKLNVVVSNLDETVIKGYYTTTKRFNTGNVGTLKAEEISKQPVSDPIAALIGRIPGLQVTQLSGAPGRAFNVQIRGRNSIKNGSSPLFIVDGVPFFNNTTLSVSTATTTIDNVHVPLGAGLETSPFNSINPNDIESIEVLKDADATAIYGSRGANGVILITTRKGTIGKTRVTANIYHGIGEITKSAPLLNTSDYLALRKESYKNDGVTSYPSNAYDINGTWDTSRYIDWQRLLIGGTTHTTDGLISFSGGSTSTQFLISLGYHRENTVFPGNYGSWKGTANYSLNHKSQNEKFKLNYSGISSYNQSGLPLQDFVYQIQLPPNAPKIYNDDGSLNWEKSTWTNPISYTFQKNTSKIKYWNSNINLNYSLLQNLQIKVSSGYTNTSVNQLAINPSKSLDPTLSPGQGYSIYGSNEISIWNIEPQAEYAAKYKKIDLNFLIGATLMQQSQQGKAFKGIGFTSDEMLENFQSASVVSSIGETYSKYKYSAVFSRLNLIYDRKYILNLTSRRDGSSRFGPGKQFANFWSVGGAWIFSDNPLFFDRLKFLSFGKIRASYGITGNDQIGDYQFLDTYQPYSPYNSYLGVIGLQPTRLLNANYAWEKNKKFELAFELGFLQNRVLLDVSYYRNRSSNQLLVRQIPTQTGFGTIVDNLDAIVQNTGIEIQATSINVKNSDFLWQSTFNISIPRNKLIEYPNLEASSDIYSYVVGESLTIHKALKYSGVDPNTGLYTFVDQNKDGKISFPEDYQNIIFTGQQYFGGLKNDFQFGNFQLNIFFQFVRQKNANNNTTMFGRPGSFGNNTQDVLNRWTVIGDKAPVQKSSNNFDAITSFSNFSQSDGRYSDGSFVRLKNISASYTFNFEKRKSITALRIYVNAQNLLTLTKYKNLDPESKSFLPPLRMVATGIQIDL